jgi:hypothetical protein
MRFGWSRVFGGRSLPATTPAIYAGAHLVLLAAAAWQFQHSTAPRPESLKPESQIEYPMVTVDDAVLITDLGREFSVFHFDPRQPAYNDKLVSTYLESQRKPQTPDESRLWDARAALLVRISRTQVGPPDGTTNCHGWVFAGGRYALSEGAVEALLQDNGYQQVAEPHAGDVVVYRNDTGNIVHTGRVRSVHSCEEVWIESKWGLGSPCVHLPLDQCYSRNMEYYRSPRPDHSAQIVKIPVAAAAGVASLRRVTARPG